jgi:hypothetical protein
VVEVAHDPRAAAVLSDGAPAGRRFVTSALLRSVRTLADQLSTMSSAAVPVAALNGNHPVTATAGEVS